MFLLRLAPARNSNLNSWTPTTMFSASISRRSNWFLRTTRSPMSFNGVYLRSSISASSMMWKRNRVLGRIPSGWVSNSNFILAWCWSLHGFQFKKTKDKKVNTFIRKKKERTKNKQTKKNRQLKNNRLHEKNKIKCK